MAPVSSSELHAGSNQKMVGACFQPRHLTRQPAESYGSYGSYGHTLAVWHLCATLSEFRLCSTPLHRGRNSDFRFFLPEKNPSPGQHRRSVSGSGKTVALISLILEQYRGVFERIYIFSPSVNIDDGWIPVKKYIEEDLGVNTEREQTYWDEWDEAALRRIIQQQRKITEASKKLEMKKLYQVLVVIDDFADTPQLHKPHGAWVDSSSEAGTCRSVPG